MQRLLRIIMLVCLVGCSTTPHFKALKRSSFTYPADAPIKLFIAQERDRSGGWNEPARHIASLS